MRSAAVNRILRRLYESAPVRDQLNEAEWQGKE